jgi:hypothetical protein
MVRYTKALESIGNVVPFDYPYMKLGRRAPDRLPVLIAAHAEALASACKGHRGKVVLIGKSMGGRVGCHLALEQSVDGLVCLGYPLKGMGKTSKLRNAVLEQLRTPVLFVQGTRDTLCPLDLLESVRGKMTALNALWVVESGDHSLLATKTHLKRHETNQADVEARVLEKISAFVATL